MTKNDWYGLGTSLVLHIGLFLLFWVTTFDTAEADTIGFVEVEFGPVAEGRPIRRGEEKREEPPRPAPEPRPEVRVSPPRDARQVALPKQEREVIDEEKVVAPKSETVSPVRENNPAEVPETRPAPEQGPSETQGGSPTGRETGASEGEEGLRNDRGRSSPYLIEGLLNRSTVSAPLPRYAEKVNADIKVRITVAPSGRIVRIFPVVKGNPRLEEAVREALQRWRFNALSADAPQRDQTGTITFRFRLE